MSIHVRFQEAAEAADDGDTLGAITALLGSDMDDHRAISGEVHVSDLEPHLSDEEMAVLGLADTPSEAIIVGYNTSEGFRLKTAVPAEVEP